MDNEFLLGLYVSAVGLGITFVALSSLILLIRVLVALFPPKQSPPADSQERRREEEAAALAVSIFLLEQAGDPAGPRDPSLGKLLEPD